MKLLRALFASLAIAAIGPASLPVELASPHPPSVRLADVSGHEIVLLLSASPAERDAAVAQVGGVVLSPVGATGYDRISVPGSAAEAVVVLLSMPGVLAAEPDGRTHATF